MKILKTIIGSIIAIYIGCKVMDEVLFFHYILSGQKLKAFFTRPFYYLYGNWREWCEGE